MARMTADEARSLVKGLERVRGGASRHFLLGVVGAESGLWLDIRRPSRDDARALRRSHGFRVVIAGVVSWTGEAFSFRSPQAAQLVPQWRRIKRDLGTLAGRLKTDAFQDADLIARPDEPEDVEMTDRAPPTPAQRMDAWRSRVAGLTGQPGPAVCDALARELVGIIQASGTPRVALRAAEATGGLLPMIHGMSPRPRAELLGAMGGLLGRATTIQEARQSIEGTDNARRAKRAMSRIADVGRRLPPERRDRLSPPVIEAILQAVARPSAPTDKGQRGLLGAWQAGLVARALAEMSDADYATTISRLALTGRDEGGSATEVGVLMQAIALRYGDAQSGTDDAEGRDFVAFADRIRGAPPRDLVAATSAIDVVGVPGARQRFTSSCAPTTAILALAELHPVFALNLRLSGDLSDATAAHDRMGRMQHDALDHFNPTGAPVSRPRGAPEAAEQLAASAGDLWTAVSVKARLEQGIKDPADLATLSAGLAALAKSDPAAAARLHADLSDYLNHPEVGVATDGITAMLAAAVAPHLHATVQAMTADPDHPGAMTDAIASVVDEGVPVPIGVRWSTGGGHAMLVADVASNPAGRAFLVADPWTGVSAWISEAALLAGDLRAIDAKNPPAALGAAWLMIPKESQ